MDIGTLTFIPVQKDLDMCMSLGCTVGRTPITLTDGYACFGCVPDGLRAKSSDDCCSLESRFSEYKNGYDYLCITTPDDSDSRQCNAAEKPIAKIIQSMDLFKDDCKTAYTVGIFGGAFLVLIVLAAMI